MDGIKRIRKEIKEIRGSQDDDIVLRPSEENIREWTAFIKGPEDTPFAGGVYQIAIELGTRYPVVPPSMRFETKIFHPNVHFADGSICLDILKEGKWTPAWGLQSACRAVIALLSDPQADSPLNCDAGNMIRAGDMIAYNSMARMYTCEHALGQLPKHTL